MRMCRWCMRPLFDVEVRDLCIRCHHDQVIRESRLMAGSDRGPHGLWERRRWTKAITTAIADGLKAWKARHA